MWRVRVRVQSRFSVHCKLPEDKQGSWLFMHYHIAKVPYVT